MKILMRTESIIFDLISEALDIRLE